MQSGTATAPVSKRRVRAGEILSGIAVLFLLFDSIIKVMVMALWGGLFLRDDRVRALIVPRR